MPAFSESLRVGAVFGPGNRLRPVWFDRKGRQYRIREVTYRWQEREGAATILHFAVTVQEEAALYELCYDTAGQHWSLTTLESP